MTSPITPTTLQERVEALEKYTYLEAQQIYSDIVALRSESEYPDPLLEVLQRRLHVLNMALHTLGIAPPDTTKIN